MLRQRTKALVVARAATLSLPPRLDDPRIVQLGARFLELRSTLFRDSVDTIVELGEILHQGSKLLRGQYVRWLGELRVPRSTANRYVQLFLASRQAPGLIQKWKELGPGKLYKLARIEPADRHEILKASRRDELLRMNDEEFAEVASPYLKRRRKVTTDMRAHGLRMKVRAWVEALGSSRVDGIQDDTLRSGLRTELRALSRQAAGLASRL
ncbi:MAG TPA: hypothetical protein VGJ84_10470 [Polyangiaceae bacterium]